MNREEDLALISEPDEELSRTPSGRYTREPQVVEELQRLRAVPARLVAKLAKDMRPETLVVLYRQSIRLGLEQTQDQILRILVAQIAPFVRRKLARVAFRDSESRLDVEQELGHMVLLQWGSLAAEQEFWEVHFWCSMSCRLVDALRRVLGDGSRAVRGGDDRFFLDLESACQYAQGGDQVVRVAMMRVLLDTLPARQKKVIELRYWYGFTETEIAERLGLSDRTVRYDLSRAHRQLLDALAETDQ